MKPLSLAALLAFMAACTSSAESNEPFAEPRASFVVEGGFLRDAEGRALTLRGMNLSGDHKLPPYFSFQEPPDYARVRADWAMNSVRFLISWAAIEPVKGVFDTAYLDAVERRMSWAREAGLLVVLDMHQDVYGEGFANGGGNGAPRWSCDSGRYETFVPSTTQWFLNYLRPEVQGCYDDFWNSKEKRWHYMEAWRRVARRLGGYGDVIVGFDPMNEPYWGSYALTAFESDVLQPFYEEVVAAVRKERPEWVAFIEPASSRNLGVPTRLAGLGFGNLVYAPHSYDREAESGMGFDDARRELLLGNLKMLADEARSLGGPLWVGEYGGMAAAPGIFDYMSAQYDGIGAAAAGSEYWSYGKGTGYSLLDADGVEKPELASALVRPWPERVAGDPLSYAFDATARAFTLRYTPDAKISAPTVIAVPPRTYPDGWAIACDGCESEAAEGAILITKPPRGEPAVLTISPK